MIAKTSQSGHKTYGLQEFTIDSPADVNQLPLDIPMGSSALCLQPLTIYVLNGQSEWVDIMAQNNEEGEEDSDEGL